MGGDLGGGLFLSTPNSLRVGVLFKYRDTGAFRHIVVLGFLCL